MKGRNRNIILSFGALLLVAGLTFHIYAMVQISKLTDVSIEFGNVSDLPGEGLSPIEVGNSRVSEDWYKEIRKYRPFKEIEAFDQDAKDWSTFFDGYGATGILVFDANNDGLPDVYLCHNNDTWARPTDENAVLQKEPRITGNGLYINRGNDENGNPDFVQIKDMNTRN